MEKDLEEKCRKIVSELKKSSVAELINYDIKTDFSEEISTGANTEWNKCNENLSEGNKLNREANFKFDILEPWEKICCCKIAPDTFDCDVSLRSMVIYGIIFPFVLENRKLELQEKDNKDELKYCFHSDDDKIFEYRGDTINSYATTIQEYIRTYQHNGNETKNFIELTSNEKWGTRTQYDYFYKKNNHWSACVLDKYDYFKAILPTEAKGFIRLNHTIGNFIPCPVGCNSPRGFKNPKINDYWDLTLYYIYKWYKIKKDEFIEFIVKKSKNEVETYKKWLEEFKCWDIFVEKNYMQDFVNYDSETRKYGMPKELWKGHFDSAKQGKVFPIKNNEKDEFAQFFTNASAWITARGTRMAIELKNKLDREDVSEIVKKLSGNDED